MTPSVPEPDPPDVTVGAVPRILVVDADERTRESIVGILGIRHRFDVVGSSGDVPEAVALLREHRPDVLIVDPRLPEVSGGLALIRRARALSPGVRILVVGWSPDLEHAALTAGADMFVRKTFKPGDLAGAIGRCLECSDAGEPVTSTVDVGPAVSPAPGSGPPLEGAPSPAAAPASEPARVSRPSLGSGVVL